MLKRLFWLIRLSLDFYQQQLPGISNDRQHARIVAQDGKPIREASPIRIERWNPDEQDHRRKERKYWRLSICLGVFTTGTAILGAILAAFALAASRDQVNTARHEQRAWISIDESLSKYVRNAGDKFGIDIGFILNNTGHSPAFHAIVHAEILPVEDGFKSNEVVEKVCDDYRNNIGIAEDRGDTVFPGGKTGHPYPQFIPKKDWLNSVSKGEAIGFLVHGCVDYMITEDTKHHQTRFKSIVAEEMTDGGVKALPADPTSVPIGVNNLGISAD